MPYTHASDAASVRLCRCVGGGGGKDWVWSAPRHLCNDWTSVHQTPCLIIIFCFNSRKSELVSDVLEMSYKIKYISQDLLTEVIKGKDLENIHFYGVVRIYSQIETLCAVLTVH